MVELLGTVPVCVERFQLQTSHKHYINKPGGHENTKSHKIFDVFLYVMSCHNRGQILLQAVVRTGQNF
jgi:hypothetical protein